MAKKLIVALVGAKRAGKDTVANYLCERYGFTNVKFSAPVKTAVMSLFDLNIDEVEGDAKDSVHERWGVRPRELLQWFGTDVMRVKLSEFLPKVGQRFWIEKLRSGVLESRAERVVVSDVRFEDEIECLRGMPGYDTIAIRIDRPGFGSGDTHVSESGIGTLKVDYTVMNDSTVDDLCLRCLYTTPLCTRIVFTDDVPVEGMYERYLEIVKRTPGFREMLRGEALTCWQEVVDCDEGLVDLYAAIVVDSIMKSSKREMMWPQQKPWVICDGDMALLITKKPEDEPCAGLVPLKLKISHVHDIWWQTSSTGDAFWLERQFDLRGSIRLLLYRSEECHEPASFGCAIGLLIDIPKN